jgi:O-antigen/teichoic acid export membrane protein
MASPGKLAELGRPNSGTIEPVAPESSRLTAATLIVRNAALNLVSEGWVFIVLLVAMPKLVRFLGETQFGLFSLAWVIIGYLTVLDIGVSRAATKFVSEHLADGNLASTRQVVRTAIIANLALGLAGGLAVALTSPLLVHYVFRVGSGLEHQANLVFYAAAVAIPVLLLQGIFRGVLSSYQRFGWITGVNTVATTVQWGLACVLAWRGSNVAFVVSSTVLVRMLAAIGYGAVLRTTVPKLDLFQLPDLAGLSKLVRFGSWVTVSQLVGPLLVYLDRVLIASFVSLSAVGLYTVPYEAMTRLRVIPSSLVASLYPAFSERGSQERQNQLNHLYERSVCYLLVLLLPTTVLLAVLGSDVLSIWMGKTFAREAVAIIEILALGVFANGMSYLPYNALQAAGRPDLTGKFHLLELPPYIALCLILIPRWGITGAALASTFRFALDAGLLFWAAKKYCRCSLQRTWHGSLRTIVMLTCSLTAALLVLCSTMPTPWLRVGAGILSVFVYLAAAWFLVVREEERPRLVSVVKTLCSATS